MIHIQCNLSEPHTLSICYNIYTMYLQNTCTWENNFSKSTQYTYCTESLFTTALSDENHLKMSNTMCPEK